MNLNTMSKILRWSSFIFFGGWLLSTFVLFDFFLGLSILLISLVLISLSVLPKDRAMDENILTKGRWLYQVAWVVSVIAIGSLIPWRLIIDESYLENYLLASTFLCFVSVILVSAYHVLSSRSLRQGQKPSSSLSKAKE